MMGAGGAEQRSAGIAPTISPPLRGRDWRGFTVLAAILLLPFLGWQGFWLRDTFVAPHHILQEMTGNAYWSAWTTDVAGWWAMDGSNGSTWGLRLSERDASELKQRCTGPLTVYPAHSPGEPIELIAGANPPTKYVPPPGKGCRIAGDHRPEDAFQSGRERSIVLYGRVLQLDENYF
jgi:hypothetical protein